MTSPADALPTIRGFAADVGERAIKTAAQTLLAYFGAGALDVLHADWSAGLSLAAGASVLSLLTSLASLPYGKGGTASLTAAVVPTAVYEKLRAVAEYGQHSAPLAERKRAPVVRQEPDDARTVPYEPYRQLKANADALDTPIYAATAESELNAMAPVEPEPQPEPEVPSPPDPMEAWAQRVLSRKSDSAEDKAAARAYLDSLTAGK